MTNSQKIESLTFHQSGGFMGMDRCLTFVISELSEARRKELLGLIKESGILAEEAVKKLNARARDAFVYEFSIMAKQRHEAVFDDTTLPESYRPMLDCILTLIAEQADGKKNS